MVLRARRVQACSYLSSADLSRPLTNSQPPDLDARRLSQGVSKNGNGVITALGPIPARLSQSNSLMRRFTRARSLFVSLPVFRADQSSR